MSLAPVIPVLAIDRREDAVPIATALVEGGVTALEVTLRTPAALGAVRLMAAVEGATVGAGIVRDAAVAAGARVTVSPGGAIRRRARRSASVPSLREAATALDLMRGLDPGLTRFKFFPAQAADGISALAAAFGDVRFCPTGGISPGSATAWLDLKAVLRVGGSRTMARDAVDPFAIEVAVRAARSPLGRAVAPLRPRPT